MKQKVIDHVKNIVGKRSPQKYVAIAIDDYGNIRTHSNEAIKKMLSKGLKSHSRFDDLDHLETREDLEALYDVLTSVKDSKGNHAIWSPLAMTGNINFEAMKENGYQKYEYEILTKSFEKLSSIIPEHYKGAWSLWRQGIESGIMRPEFHGREHLNLKSFNYKLKNKDVEAITSLENRSYSFIGSSGFENISTTAAFEFESLSENESFQSIVAQGLKDFETVYGYAATVFNPPGGREHPLMHEYLKKGGIKFLETPWVKNEHQGNGKYKKVINYSGKKNHLGMTYSVRNVVFEPTDNRGYDPVNYALNQVDAAFFWNKPAIISSHRVNFCGMLNEKNRQDGLEHLSKLLKGILDKHPDALFIGIGDLCDLQLNS